MSEREIYLIINTITDQWYIGCSVNAEKRFKKHLYKAYSGKQIIHKNIQQYGKENFILEILEKCKVEIAADRECYWIDYFSDRKGCLNERQGGGGIASEESRQKMGKWIRSKETCQKISQNNPKVRKVKETITNIAFDFIKDAAAHFDISHHDIGWCCEMNAGKDFYIKKAIKRIKEKGLNFEYI